MKVQTEIYLSFNQNSQKTAVHSRYENPILGLMLHAVHRIKVSKSYHCDDKGGQLLLQISLRFAVTPETSTTTTEVDFDTKLSVKTMMY